MVGPSDRWLAPGSTICGTHALRRWRPREYRCGPLWKSWAYSPGLYGYLLPNGNLFIPPFSTANYLPFPTEDNPVDVPVTLPYIAFDGAGQLISGLSGQPELIPISEGSVGIARNPDTKVPVAQPAQPNEMPPGNTVENYSLVYIDRLTGRAHVERRKVQ